MANVAATQRALDKRKAHILNNVETISLKGVRRLLEKDMKLDSKALDPMKDYIKDVVHNWIQGSRPAAKNDAQRKTHAPKRPKQRVQRDTEGENAEAEEEEDVRPRKRSKDGAARAPAAAAKPAARQLSKSTARLRQLCLDAGLKVGPHLYRANKDDDSLARALRAMLAEHGLTERSDKREVARVRKQLETQRDLEGIDTSNILSDEGRPRRAAAARAVARVAKSTMVDADSDEDDRANGGSPAEQSVDSEPSRGGGAHGSDSGGSSTSEDAGGNSSGAGDDDDDDDLSDEAPPPAKRLKAKVKPKDSAAGSAKRPSNGAGDGARKPTVAKPASAQPRHAKEQNLGRLKASSLDNGHGAGSGDEIEDEEPAQPRKGGKKAAIVSDDDEEEWGEEDDVEEGDVGGEESDDV